LIQGAVTRIESGPANPVFSVWDQTVVAELATKITVATATKKFFFIFPPSPTHSDYSELSEKKINKLFFI